MHCVITKYQLVHNYYWQQVYTIPLSYIWDSRLPYCCWGFRSPGMWCCAKWLVHNVLQSLPFLQNLGKQLESNVQIKHTYFIGRLCNTMTLKDFENLDIFIWLWIIPLVESLLTQYQFLTNTATNCNIIAIISLTTILCPYIVHRLRCSKHLLMRNLHTIMLRFLYHGHLPLVQVICLFDLFTWLIHLHTLKLI